MLADNSVETFRKLVTFSFIGSEFYNQGSEWGRTTAFYWKLFIDFQLLRETSKLAQKQKYNPFQDGFWRLWWRVSRREKLILNPLRKLVLKNQLKFYLNAPKYIGTGLLFRGFLNWKLWRFSSITFGSHWEWVVLRKIYESVISQPD